MSRIKLTLQYKGGAYAGWQVQPNGLTIQAVVQKALTKIFNKKTTIIGSGRTDAGVHALGQVCHFDLSLSSKYAQASEGSLKHRLLHSLNALLPHDIAATDLKKVSDNFHAQKSAKKKTYTYTILNSSIPSPFLEETAWRVVDALNVEQMKKAAAVLVGEHDFKSFCASDSTAKTSVRTIYKISITAPKNSKLITINITGNGFLKQMVRAIVGTLVSVGQGKTTQTQLRQILKACDRRKAGKTAPAKGLILKKVVY